VPQPAGAPGGGFSECDRPGRFAATSAEDDEEFLRQCRERAEEQRKRHREQQSGPDAPQAGPG